MESARYLELLAEDGRRLADVARQGLDADVPPCPGWTVRDVVVHTGMVYHHKIACMRLNRRPGDDEYLREPPAGSDPADWFVVSLEALLAELRSRGPDTPSYTWWEPDQTSGFWYRRMAQETAIHRADAESAFGPISPVDHELAVDGIDEVLLRFLAGDWSDEPVDEGAGRQIAVSAGGQRWVVALAPDRVTADEGDTAADAEISGDPSALLLWLWGRGPSEELDVRGDAGLTAVLRSRLVLATQ
jgi:uncharacterized protein (TIGR03083 family)